jgi:hypothetical protein
MPADLRAYTRQTKYRALVWFVIILVVVGLGLVWLLYGKGAALMGLLCLVGALIPVSLIALAMLGLDLLAGKNK